VIDILFIGSVGAALAVCLLGADPYAVAAVLMVALLVRLAVLLLHMDTKVRPIDAPGGLDPFGLIKRYELMLAGIVFLLPWVLLFGPAVMPLLVVVVAVGYLLRKPVPQG
jgi:hypothetical protein